MKKTNNFYIASLSSGEDYKGKYYYFKKSYDEPKIVNIQLRYLFEALDKFDELTSESYTAEIIEEGILIINLLSNSLLVLGGMNDKSGKDRTPSLLGLYSGSVWNLKNEESDAYNILDEMNYKYNNLSKHINRTKAKQVFEIDYLKIEEYIKNTYYIWNWVVKKEGHSKLKNELFPRKF